METKLEVTKQNWTHYTKKTTKTNCEKYRKQTPGKKNANKTTTVICKKNKQKRKQQKNTETTKQKTKKKMYEQNNY